MLSKHVLIAAAIAATVLTGCKKADEVSPPATPMQAPTPQAAPAAPAPTTPSASTPSAGTITAPTTSDGTTKAPGAASSASGSASY